MRKPIENLHGRLYLSAIIVLVLGLCGAALIYLTAEDDSSSALGYVIIDGTVYRTEPGDSRMYRNQLERFGGKPAVVFDRFNRWFASLWQGKSLAITVAWISVLASLGVFLFARYIAPEARPDVRAKDNRADEN